MTPSIWLFVFIAWRVALAAAGVIAAAVVRDWRTVLLAFASGALAVDTVYLTSAARSRPRRHP